jgi:trimeric autotransporter adhesin
LHRSVAGRRRLAIATNVDTAAQYRSRSIITTLNADGSTTEMIKTAFGDSLANLRSETVTTTSANGLSIVTEVDNDGNGVFEQIDTTTIAPDGSRTEVFDYYGDTTAATQLQQSNTYTVSANGLATMLTTSTGITDTTVDFANSNGSYEWSQTVTANSAAATAGYAAGSATHDIDANGIDTWSWQRVDVDLGQYRVVIAADWNDRAIV